MASETRTGRVAKWLQDHDNAERNFMTYEEEAREMIALIRPTPEPVVWRFKRPDGRWEYDEGVGPPKIVGGIEAWEAKGWIFEALYNDKEPNDER